MADPRFFSNAGPFSLRDIARECGGDVDSAADTERMITDVAPLQTAGSEQLTFLDNPKYARYLSECQAGACILHQKHADKLPAKTAAIFSDNPYATYARAAHLFYPNVNREGLLNYSGNQPAIASSAIIAKGVSIAPGAYIGPYAENVLSTLIALTSML